MEDLKGRVWKFGNNVDTDVIVPGQYLDAPMEEIVGHVLETVNPDFASEVKPGDMIVAGTNFGCGSSREHAPDALKKAGIACILAESFGRIFFRNAIAIGLPVLTCRHIGEAFTQGQQAHVSIDRFQIVNMDTGAVLQGDALSQEMKSILEKGGIIEYLKDQIATAGSLTDTV